MKTIPNIEAVRAAVARAGPFVHHTPVMISAFFNEQSGSQVFFKCENFQTGGAFKFRGALNAVLSLSDEEAAHGVVTHSSGNHAGALAIAARIRRIAATIVMPTGASAVKRNAAVYFGATIIDCEPTLEARERTADEVVQRTGGTLVHPYDDTRIIAGQGTAALELLDEVDDLDIVMTPVGGGGLLSGTAITVSAIRPQTRIIGAEPTGADDAFRSLEAGRLIPVENPDTIADGLRTSLSELTFAVIQKHVSAILTVDDAQIIRAMRMISEQMSFVIEPSAAVPVAALLNEPERFRNLRVGIILSGSNLNRDDVPRI